MTLEENELRQIKSAIEKCGGVQGASKLLGVGKSTIYRKIKGSGEQDFLQKSISQCFAMLQAEADAAREKHDLSPHWIKASDATVQLLEYVLKEMSKCSIATHIRS